jgi:hypothetical protein
MIDCYVKYDVNGDITEVYYGTTPTDQVGSFLLVTDNQIANEISDYKVVGGVLTAKPTNPTTNPSGLTLLANGTASVTFSNIPAGSLMTIEAPERAAGTEYTTINDGTIVFKTTVAGDYFLTLTNSAYMSYKVTIEANEP